MEETQVRVGTQTTIDVVMRSSALQIDEVVVTAMGIKTEKKKLNFAVQSLNNDDLTVGQPTNFVDALQGRIAGIDVSGQGGSPSGNSQILIRGVSSVNPGQDNEPIFILDGVHISGGASRAADINPNDIESITILKGAAAAALYGQEAANGAIMVTTKSAKAGALKVEASAIFRIENAVRVPEIQQMYVNAHRFASKGTTVLINELSTLCFHSTFPVCASRAKIKPFLVLPKTTPSFSISIEGACS